jgi:glycosyltransferase involved in cell wall biosynthesis
MPVAEAMAAGGESPPRSNGSREIGTFGERLVAAGARRSTAYTWESTAAQTLAVLRAVTAAPMPSRVP